MLQKKLTKTEFLLLRNPFVIPEKWSPIKESSERNYVAWLGVFTDQKNLPGLLDIVRELPHLDFKIAGSPPTNKKVKPSIQEMMDQLAACPNVELVGFLSRHQIAPFLASAWCLLNTSHYEGFSNTFLESLAAGTPIITRQDIDPDHFIANNNLGVIVSDYNQVPQTLSSFINSIDHSKMGERCRAYILNHHHQMTLCEELMNAMRDLR